MISTKSYFYFDHLNPKHNVKKRKNSNIKVLEKAIQARSIQPTLQYQQIQMIAISGIKGTSYQKRLSQVADARRYRRSGDFRLTFEKLQQIICDLNPLPKKSIKSSITNPQQQSSVFVVKNSSIYHTNCPHRYKKTQKNQQLKQCLFNQNSSFKRSKTTMSNHSRTCRSPMVQNSTKDAEYIANNIMISTSMNEVFIPSSSLKKHSSRTIRRYKTVYGN